MTNDILFQQDICWQLFLYHVNDLHDEEALWCISPDGLQIRTADGDWSADWPETEGYHIGPSSIAWTLWHILYWWRTVMDHSFGNGTLQKEDVVWPGSTEKAVAEITSLHDVWVQHISHMSKEKLQSTELCKWPFEGQSFYDLALWLNVEFMKNVTEIGSGRFLYAVAVKNPDEK